jgi:PhnB protein
VTLHLHVTDVDAVVKRAEAAGATVLRQPKDEFFGDRNATIMDPFGHRWGLATRKENVSPAEMQKRWSKMLGG